MTDYSKFYNTYLSSPLKGTGNNRTTDCPFCESENKLSINIRTSKGQCLHAQCGKKINHLTFLKYFHEAWLEFTEDAAYEELSELRGISIHTLKNVAKWAYDGYRNRWLVPYYNPLTGHLTNLGTFVTHGDSAFRIYKAPNIEDTNGIGTVPLTFYVPSDQTDLKDSEVEACYIAEGEWDALALIDLQTRWSPDDVLPVIATPGANMFQINNQKWFEAINTYYLVYDNDDAGRVGTERAGINLRSWGKEVHTLDWSQIEDAKEDMDVRDLLLTNPDEGASLIYESLVEYIPVDEDDPEQLSAGYVITLADITPITSYEEYLDGYQSAGMHLSECNQDAIAITMATAACQYLSAAQNEGLWFFLQGPAGSGKTTLIESFGGQNEYFDYASRITAKNLVSGWQAGGKEPSLIHRMNNKCFFIKDFTVVLDMPKEQRKEVFSLFRDIYDGTLHITFGNGKVCNFHNLNFNLIAGVTDEILAHSDANMGERFLRLDYSGAEIDDEKIIKAALRGFGKSSGKKGELTDATLGYVKTLLDVENRWDIYNMPNLSASSITALTNMARYVAYTRARTKEDRKDGIMYRPRKEVAARLALQFCKLGYSLEKVHNPFCTGGGSKSYDLSDNTLRLIKKVAFDTSAGFQQDIITRLAQSSEDRMTRATLKRLIGGGINDTRLHKTIQSLAALDIVGTFKQSQGEKGRPSDQITLSRTFRKIAKTMFE